MSQFSHRNCNHVTFYVEWMIEWIQCCINCSIILASDWHLNSIANVFICIWLQRLLVVTQSKACFADNDDILNMKLQRLLVCHVNALHYQSYCSHSTHWALGEMGVILKEQFSNSLYEFDFSAIYMKLTSEERLLTPLMMSQHWFR